MEATFEVHKCLDIVLGNESNLTSVDDDGRSIGPVGERFQAAISSWETRHALAREALLRSLNQPTFSKLFLIATVSQQFEPVSKLNTVELSTSSIFESTMNVQISVKTQHHDGRTHYSL